ncbi:MAG: TetR/AcrR family transcriptional regulator [Spirosomataceae bacterium]
MTTKQKISKAALFLFNRFGFVNVRLQHIADEANLSVGNLAYHFKTKDDILEHLYEQLVGEQQRLLANLRMIPLFVNLDEHLQHTFQIQQQYSFFFTDTLEILRAYPTIKRKHREHIYWQTIQIQLFLEFNVSRMALLPPQEPDTLALLANRYTMITDSWLSYEVLLGQKAHELTATRLKELIWSLLSSYFSDMGRSEFQQMRSLPFDPLT